MKNYDISVIIPLYNCEKYINKAIKSLLNQTYDFRKIEVLLINDGSSDTSLEIAKNYAKKYSNIKVFSHENKGVSYTRNVGLKNALGAYITFLDADDYISNNTIKNLVNFFDNNSDKIDILTYPLFYEKGKKITPAPKNGAYEKTGIYNLNGATFYNISTINFVIKNKKKSNLLFNETLKIHEDMDYSLRVAMEKGYVGYVKEAGYYYIKHDGSTVSNYINPYYIFESWIGQFEQAFRFYRNEDGSVKKFIQHLFLNEINWKLKEKVLYPVHYNDIDLKKAKTRIEKLVNMIDDDIILKNKDVDKFHKYYFLSMKKNNFDVKTGDNIELVSNGKVINREKDIEIVLTQFKTLNDTLYVSGYFKSYLFNFINPSFYVIVDGVISKLDVKISTNSCYKTIYKTNNFYHFDLELDINNNYMAEFKVQLNDKLYPVKYYLMPNIVLNKNLNRMLYLYNNNVIGIDKSNNIIISKVTDSKKKQIEKDNYLMYKKINKKINFFRKLANKCNKEIWLYNDKENIIDNAYYQFKHDFNEKDDIKRYYIISNRKDFFKGKFTKKELKHVIYYRSFKHKLLYLNANKILTSFRNIEFYCPFYKNISYYQDLLNYELIYVQHGILHCHTPNLYSKEANNIDKIVVSSDFEYNNFIDNYNYNHKNLIKTGMPRFDICSLKKNKSNKILIALSWRVNLMGPYKNRTYAPNNEKFKTSVYFKQLTNLIDSNKFNNLLRKNNLEVEIMSHPIFRCYDNFFNEKDNIKFVQSANPNDYLLVITDYSSIIFDYVYANTPVIYFVPDYDLYKAGITHLYNKLDLPMENGFGPFTTNINDLLFELNKFINANYKLDKKYINKANNFFICKENHREKLYQELMNK